VHLGWEEQTVELPWWYAGIGLVLSLGGIASAIRARGRAWTLQPEEDGHVSLAGPLVGAGAILVVLTSVALTALGGVLARTHVPGIADRGMESITGLNSVPHMTSAAWFQELPIRWHEWQLGAGQLIFDRPAHVLAAYLRLDTLVFVPAYALLLGYVFARSVERSGRFLDTTGTPRRWEAWLMSDPRRPGTRRRMSGLEIAMYSLLVAAVIADLLENLFIEAHLLVPLSENRLATWNTVTLRVLVCVKLVGLTAIVVFGILPSALVVLQRSRSARGLPGSVARRLRALLVVVALFGLLVTLRGFQVPDSIRRWNPVQGASTVLVVVGFGFVLAWSATGLLRARRVRTEPISTRALFIASLSVAGAILAGAFLGHVPQGLFLPLLVLIVLWLFDRKLDVTDAGQVIGVRAEDSPSLNPLIGEPGSRAFPALLAVAPVLFLLIAAARATVPQTVFNHPTDYGLQRLVIFLAVIAPSVALVVYWALVRWILAARGSPTQDTPRGDLSSSEADTTRVHLLRPALVIVGAAYVWWRVISAPWSFPQAVGAVVVVALFLLFVGLSVAWLSRLQVSYAPPLSLRVFGFRQLPVFLLVLVWIVLVIPFSRKDYHDVRLVPVDRPVAQVAPADAVDRWFEGTTVDGRMHPMVFVTANGGGIKAAVWAAMVLDCVFGDAAAIESADVRTYCSQFNPEGVDRWSGSVFVASGVSGGTLGLVTFDRLRSADPDDWLRIALGDDFVSPTMAWQTFVEAPQTYLQIEDADDMDRAEVLERAWERADLQRPASAQLADALWRGDNGYSDVLGQPFLSAGGADPQPPYLIFNGSSVEDGCRLEVSSIQFTDQSGSLNCTGIRRLDVTPADPQEVATVTRDLFPFLCDQTAGSPQDVRASTAVTLAARFPVVSPSGRLVACVSDDEVAPHVHIVDGGYGDNSGGAAVAALWRAIAPDVVDSVDQKDPCAVPVLLEIDSGYGPTPESKKQDVPELTVPLVGSGSAREVRTIEGRDEAALAFRRPFGSVQSSFDRHAIVYLRTNPEGEASLGWTMDDSTFDQMEAQLVSNADQLLAVSRWFSEPCAT
jgi:hypothetical protein